MPSLCTCGHDHDQHNNDGLCRECTCTEFSPDFDEDAAELDLYISRATRW